MKIRIAIVFLSIVAAGCVAAPTHLSDTSDPNDKAAPPVVLNYEAGTDTLSLVTDRRIGPSPVK